MSKKEVMSELNRTLAAIDAVCPEGTEKPTLKAIAAALDVPQQRIYSVAKQPKAGEVYDANVYNWDAIDRFITRRLDPDTMPTHEDVIRKALEMDQVFKTQDRRRGVRATTKNDIVLADGTSMPARKMNLEIGTKVMLKKEEEPHVYEVVLMTESHVILQRVGTSILASYSNWTANQKFLTDETRFDELIESRKTALEARKTPTSEQPDEAEAIPEADSSGDTVIG